ncbi:MAG: alpha/beta family hydrolase [Acetobacterales bacterium]
MAAELRAAGPSDAAAAVFLAHGAGLGMDAPFMRAVAEGLAGHGLRTIRFEFPYMAATRADGKRRPPDRMPALLARFRAVVADTPTARVVLAGKSMGARVALALCREREAKDLPPSAALCFGFPFHPPGKPDRLRTDAFENLRTPTLVLQGSRDPFGTFAEAGGLGLPGCVTLRAVPDGDHGFKPRKASGRTEAGNIADAVAAAAAFIART